MFGALLCAVAIARFGSRLPIVLCSAAGAVSAFVLQQTPTESTGLLIAGLGLHGLFVNAVQSTMFALCAHVYPTNVRATGTALLSPSLTRAVVAVAPAAAELGLREGRLGLVFNALLKIPMQFLILLLGALVFVFYTFERAPVFFNQAEWRQRAEGPGGATFKAIEERHAAVHAERRAAARAWLDARDGGRREPFLFGRKARLLLLGRLQRGIARRQHHAGAGFGCRRCLRRRGRHRAPGLSGAENRRKLLGLLASAQAKRYDQHREQE